MRNASSPFVSPSVSHYFGFGWSIPKLRMVAARKFLPTNLPTANGSYSPFQRLGSPRENVSR